MKHLVLAALLVAATVAVVSSEESGVRVAVKTPYDPHKSRHSSGGGTTIQYHGGPVLNHAPNVYVIFYGNFETTSAKAAGIITNFLTDINNAMTDNPYKVNTGYNDSSGTFIQPMFTYNAKTFQDDKTGSLYYDSYSLGPGATVTSSGVQQILQNAFAGGLPAYSNALYFVLTSPDVPVQGFCHSYCAYHTNRSFTVSGGAVDIKYALVPDATQKCSACDGNVAVFGENVTPNGDMGADEMTDSMIHELSEAFTDPDLNAWYTGGEENGDLCNYNYGPGPYLTANGATANFKNNGRYYLIQWIWKRAQGPCAANP